MLEEYNEQEEIKVSHIFNCMIWWIEKYTLLTVWDIISGISAQWRASHEGDRGLRKPTDWLSVAHPVIDQHSCRVLKLIWSYHISIVDKISVDKIAKTSRYKFGEHEKFIWWIIIVKIEHKSIRPIDLKVSVHVSNPVKWDWWLSMPRLLKWYINLFVIF